MALATRFRTIATVVATSGVVVGGSLIAAAPASAYVGELYDCKTTRTSVGPGVDLRTTKCKKQLSSIRGVYSWVTTSSDYVVRKGTRF